jgi:hypothetical protein
MLPLGPLAIGQYAELIALKNGIFNQKSKFSKFNCCKNLNLKMRVKSKSSHAQILNLM